MYFPDGSLDPDTAHPVVQHILRNAIATVLNKVHINMHYHAVLQSL